MSSSRKAITIALCAIVLSSSEALAWGRKGHGIVAQIAEDNLTPEARLEVRILLAADGAKDMASVASWADTPEAKALPNRPMHTVRMTMDGTGYDPATDCPESNCIVEAIKRSEALLADRATPIDQQVIALKDLIHFIGDIHQPLHTAANIGGQQATLRGASTTLHEVWDQRIIADQKLSYKKLAAQIENEPSLKSYVGGEPQDWAVEGLHIAMNEIYSENAPANKRAAASDLDEEYTTRHWNTVRTRLQQAGLRLAAVLNRIYR